MKRTTILAVFVLLFVVGCSKNKGSQTKKDEKPAEGSATQAQSADKSSESGDSTGSAASAEKGESEAAAKGSERNCGALVDHMYKLSEKAGQKTTDKEQKMMTEMCSKADNLDDNKKTVDCIMAAETLEAGQKCEGQKQMMREWVAAGSDGKAGAPPSK